MQTIFLPRAGAEDYSPAMPTHTRNGISYIEEGAGQAVVLVHGFPLSNRIWAAQINALKDKARVIAPDLPGFGQSQPSKPFTMQSMADDLHQFLRSIDALPCTLAGLSMGGYIAFAHIIRYPTDFSALMLIDTRCEADTPEGKSGRQKMIDSVRASGSKAVSDVMLPKMLAPDAVQSRPNVMREMREIMEGCPPKTIEYALGAMRDRADHRDKLASIAVPTLILVGDQDAITPPAMSEFMNREICNSRLCVIHGAGHMTCMEQPEQVNRAMHEFLATIK